MSNRLRSHPFSDVFWGVGRYIAAADSASAVPEKTVPGSEEEKAAFTLEVRSDPFSARAVVESNIEDDSRGRQRQL